MSEQDLDSPGGRLKYAREQAGYADAAEFARAAKINPTTYRAYENDQNKYAKRAFLFERLTGFPASWLLEGGPVPEAGVRRERQAPIAPVEVKTSSLQTINEGAFQTLLSEVLKISAGIELPEETVRPTAAILALCLRLLEENPAIHANHDAIRAVVRAVAARPHVSRPGA